MASLAEMERELTIERTRAGLEVARKVGRKGGRKRQMTDSKIKSAKKPDWSAVIVRASAKTSGTSIKGDGWTLELKPGLKTYSRSSARRSHAPIRYVATIQASAGSFLGLTVLYCPLMRWSAA